MEFHFSLTVRRPNVFPNMDELISCFYAACILTQTHQANTNMCHHPLCCTVWRLWGKWFVSKGNSVAELLACWWRIEVNSQNEVSAWDKACDVSGEMDSTVGFPESTYWEHQNGTWKPRDTIRTGKTGTPWRTLEKKKTAQDSVNLLKSVILSLKGSMCRYGEVSWPSMYLKQL